MASSSASSSFEPIKRFADSRLKWLNPPGSEEEWVASGKHSNIENSNSNDDQSKDNHSWWKINNQGELLFAPPPRQDFWRKTYYQPLLVKDDGVALLSEISATELPITIETSFEIRQPKSQFDQAGILIRLDHEHWIKTGIEVVDDQPRLSCVVTNGFSDWSTQNWSTPGVKLRVHMLPQHGGSFVVEAAPLLNNSDPEQEEYSFIRIAHINKEMNHNLLNDDPKVQNAFVGATAPPNSYLAGVFAARPVGDQLGMVTTFHHLSIAKGSQFVHDA